MESVRYTLRNNADTTWSIVDIFTDAVVVVDDQVSMTIEENEADEFVHLLNSIDLQRRHIFERQ